MASLPVRLDLHNHTAASRDGMMSPILLLRKAAERGVNCLAVTDHDSFAGARECLGLSLENPTLPRVIPGEEITTSQGEIIGLYLRERIDPGLSLAETAACIRAQGGLVYLPHPFDIRRGTIKPEARAEAANLADIVEVANGRFVRRSFGRKALLLTASAGKLLGAGSDAHFPSEVGRVYLQVARIPTRDDLLEVLRTARPSAEPEPWKVAFPLGRQARSGLLKAIGHRVSRAQGGLGSLPQTSSRFREGTRT